MSPILIRPVREQLEHDRVIRILLLRLRRKYEVTANVGGEQAAPVKIGRLPLFPDLVLTSPGRAHRLAGIVEVETAESVNHLEAMAQWAPFGRARVPFSLYVPAGSVDAARRLCADKQVSGADIWSYHPIGDQVRFALVHKASTPPSQSRSARARRRSANARRKKPGARAAARAAGRRAQARRQSRSKKRK